MEIIFNTKYAYKDIIMKNIEYFELLDKAYNSINDESDIYLNRIKNIILNTAQELARRKDLNVSAVHLTKDFSGIYMLSKGRLHLNQENEKLFKISNKIAQNYLGKSGMGMTVGSLFH